MGDHCYHIGRKKTELVVYELKGVAQVWFNQWKEKRVINAGPIDWEKFKVFFIGLSPLNE